MFSQDDSWKSVIEILDYFLFLVENYDYLRSRIIFWEEGHVVSSNFCALPPLLQASFISLKNKYLIKKKLLLPYSSITQHVQDFPPTLPSNKFFKIAQLYQIIKIFGTICYTWNSTIWMQMTQPCYYWHFRPSEKV